MMRTERIWMPTGESLKMRRLGILRVQFLAL